MAFFWKAILLIDLHSKSLCVEVMTKHLLAAVCVVYNIVKNIFPFFLQTMESVKVGGADQVESVK